MAIPRVKHSPVLIFIYFDDLVRIRTFLSKMVRKKSELTTKSQTWWMKMKCSTKIWQFKVIKYSFVMLKHHKRKNKIIMADIKVTETR